MLSCLNELRERAVVLFLVDVVPTLDINLTM